MAFTISEVTNVNGGKIIKERGNIHLIINSGTQTVTSNQFRSQGLTSLVIPNSVTSIGNTAFLNNQLTSVVIGTNVTFINSSAFRENQLTSVVIPDSVTKINNNAFAQNPNLVEVSLKQSLYTWITNTSSTNAVFRSQVTNYIKR